jgi:hypothetical protein
MKRNRRSRDLGCAVRAPTSASETLTARLNDEDDHGVAATATLQTLHRCRPRLVELSKGRPCTQLHKSRVAECGTATGDPTTSGGSSVSAQRALPPFARVSFDATSTAQRASRRQGTSAAGSGLARSDQSLHLGKIRTDHRKSQESKRSRGTSDDESSPISSSGRQARATSWGSINGNPGSARYAQQLRLVEKLPSSSNGVKMACTGQLRAAREALTGTGFVRKLAEVFRRRSEMRGDRSLNVCRHGASCGTGYAYVWRL